MTQLRFSSAAKLHLKEQSAWYENCRKGLGRDFILCIDEAVERIRRYPDASPVIYRGLRRMLIHRFPFAVFYRAEPDAIMVLAVLHCSRKISYSR